MSAASKRHLAESVDAAMLERAFTDICDELGCQYDNEEALLAAASLRRERDELYHALFDLRAENARLRGLADVLEERLRGKEP